MTQQPASVTLGEWKKLDGYYGQQWSQRGEWVAGVNGQGCSIWWKDDLVAEWQLNQASLGWPRIVDGQLYLANGYVDLDKPKDFHTLPGIIQHFNLGFSPSPQGQYLPSTYAWSPDGKEVVTALKWQGRKTDKPSCRILWLDRTGALKKVLYEGNNEVPKSIWISQKWIVIGFRQAMVYSREGNDPEVKIPFDPLVERIETNDDESRLLMMNHKTIHIWHTKQWEIINTWEGPWIDASIHPSGQYAFAIDFERRLHIASIDEDIKTLKIVEVPDQITSLLVGNERLLASFAVGTSIRSLPLQFQ